jgi:hypothetical protein
VQNEEGIMSKHHFILVLAAVLILAIGVLLGTHVVKRVELIPAAKAGGIVVNQNEPDRAVAAVFTVSEDGSVLFWWRVQNNALGQVSIFNAASGKIIQQDLHLK